MAPSGKGSEEDETPSGVFATTHWNVVLAVGHTADVQASAALEKLCRTYWYPLYAFVRRQGHSPHDTEDLLQGFFARFLEKHYLGDVNPAKGRFRSFLLAAMKHYLANEWDKAKAVKRGGRIDFLSLEGEAAESRYYEEPVSELTPEKLYEQRWAYELLERVMERLQSEFVASGQGPLFEALKDSLLGERQGVSYADVAVLQGLSEEAVKKRVQRMRKQYQRLLREEIAHTVARPEDVDEEIRYLFSVVGG
ncbi:MAG TPA: sigma-70 family RNA polymerase sigma factor [Candidatus Paceibacterota bacterium]|nr:sigma-70 family RNA polymerase sigma factor [Verrucomicrobiota bacterium]HRY50691.1 sigma-70 family RNA polymerase sigma factor [Candidatus Paceibacterota bacterium]